LDAMAMGKPVVSTTIGCEGLRVTHGQDILIGIPQRISLRDSYNCSRGKTCAAGWALLDVLLSNGNTAGRESASNFGRPTVAPSHRRGLHLLQTTNETVDVRLSRVYLRS